MVKQDFLRAMECIYEACMKNCDPDRGSGRITEMVMNVTLKPKLHEIAISWLSSDMLKDIQKAGLEVRFHRTDSNDGILPIIKIGRDFVRTSGDTVATYHNVSAETILNFENTKTSEQ